MSRNSLEGNLIVHAVNAARAGHTLMQSSGYAGLALQFLFEHFS